YDQQDLVRDRRRTVVVLIPQYDDGVPAFLPGWRLMDGADESSQHQVALIDQRRIEMGLRAIVVRIEVARGASIAASVLIVTLIGRDERKRRDSSSGKVVEQSVRALKADDVLETVPRIVALLHVSEIHKRVVLRGVQLHETLMLARQYAGDVRAVRE